MEEVSNTGAVLEEVPAQLETASPQTEATQETVSDASDTQNKSQHDQQDKSWVKKVRRDRDEAIRQRQEVERQSQLKDELIRQLMANQAQQPQKASEDILQKVQRQEYVAGEDVARALQQQKEDFQRQLEELKKNSEHQKVVSMFSELKREFSDFDDVVNPETLALLDEIDPATATSIAEIKDPSKAGRLAYKMIKSSGLVDQVPGERRAREVEKKLAQNKKTVQSPQAFEKRPMAQAMHYPETKEAKQALWAETLKYAQMAGGGY